MMQKRDWLFFTIVSLITLLAISLPYILAARAGTEGYHFGGFLLNPQDGNSYLAKMYQGWQGKWRFQLPFTPSPGEGTYLFLFYIALGHLARITQMTLVTVFHIARIISSLAMLWALWVFMGIVMQTRRSRYFTYAAASMGSGMGWLAIVSGTITSDFWIAETYPFLSAYANPHFPLGLCLILGLISTSLKGYSNWITWVFTCLGTLVLSIVNPFGVVVLLMVLAGYSLWQYTQKTLTLTSTAGLLVTVLSGLPFVFYDLWVANTDPTLQIWNRQNLTPSPPLWDFVISLSPALLLGLVGMYAIFKEIRGGKKPVSMLLVIWVVLGILAIYLPIGLQRRFMTGIFVPIAGLAGQGFEALSVQSRRRTFLIIVLFFTLAIPSNLLTLIAAQSGIQTRNPKIFLSEDEMAAITWLEQNTEADSIILCGPEMGLLVPAYTGRRVIYGHPFETVNAEKAEKLVLEFYSRNLEDSERNIFIENNQIDLVMMSPREEMLGEIVIPEAWIPIYQQGNITIYDPETP